MFARRINVKAPRKTMGLKMMKYFCQPHKSGAPPPATLNNPFKDDDFFNNLSHRAVISECVSRAFHFHVRYICRTTTIDVLLAAGG